MQWNWFAAVEMGDETERELTQRIAHIVRAVGAVLHAAAVLQPGAPLAAEEVGVAEVAHACSGAQHTTHGPIILRKGRQSFASCETLD